MTENVTVRVTVELPRNQYEEDFTVERSTWDAMTELQQADYVDKELFPVALSNAGVGGNYKVVDGNEDDG
jgi:hypothetical protein